MAIVKRKPRNSSLRFQTFLSNSDLTTKKPEKNLTKGLNKKAGRNAYGRITVRHKGGGAAKKYRVVDFHRALKDVPGKISTVDNKRKAFYHNRRPSYYYRIENFGKEE